MRMGKPRPLPNVVLEPAHLGTLIERLTRKGYQVVGPTVRDGAIVYETIHALSDLPIGWTDEQEGGSYRLKRCDGRTLFGYAVGPHSWKRFLHPPLLRLWKAKRDGEAFEGIEGTGPAPRYAFIGVRSCELHAMAIQDRVFMAGSYIDPSYAAHREKVFIVAVNCARAGGTCFCASMHTGPRVTSGFDLALTEVLEKETHYLLVEIGTERGAELLQGIPSREAEEAHQQASERVVAKTADKMGRVLDTQDIRNLLYRNEEHPRWEAVAGRCLACANCTMVCPTCFCTTVEDVTDLKGEEAQRWRKWDSCFTMAFSYIHGGSVRASVKSRYRQWLTHKLAGWIDQFGTSGCVGCGRCITWCPVAIDITEEVRAIRESE